jgi:hypothetical protein
MLISTMSVAFLNVLLRSYELQEDSGNDGASDQDGHLDASESAEMEVA